MSDAARKRVLAVVKTKKQVVKLYAVTKWARDAGTVQKCMVCSLLHHPFSKARTQMLKSAPPPPLRDRIEHNFLMNQNQQFEDAIGGLKYAKDSLDPARCVWLLYPFSALALALGGWLFFLKFIAYLRLVRWWIDSGIMIYLRRWTYSLQGRIDGYLLRSRYLSTPPQKNIH
jgi:hypothetical protein